MNNLINILKIIVALTFLYCIVEQILPNKSYKKYISFIYGIISILTIINGFSNVSFDYKNYSYDTYKCESEKYLKEVYELKLTKLLSDKFNDNTISVILDDNYKIKNIECKNKETYESIMRYLNESNQGNY